MPKSAIRLVTGSLILVVALGFAKTAATIANEQAIPDTPDGTVLAVAAGLQDNHPEILWTALPASYRQDITEITRTFAEKMDPVVYDRAFALVMRAVAVLDDRKEVILASETFQFTGADADEIRTSAGSQETRRLKGDRGGREKTSQQVGITWGEVVRSRSLGEERLFPFQGSFHTGRYED